MSPSAAPCPALRRSTLADAPQARLLYTADDADFIYLYRADVSPAVTDLVERPHLPPRAPAALAIHTTAIPYRPIETMRERILALVVCPDGSPAGPADPGA